MISQFSDSGWRIQISNTNFYEFQDQNSTIKMLRHLEQDINKEQRMMCSEKTTENKLQRKQIANHFVFKNHWEISSKYAGVEL